MVYCAIKGCKSSSNKHTKHKDNLTFHQIPLDAFTRQKWIRSFKYKNEWLPRSTRICSRHFAKECLYVTNKGLVKITKGADPSLYLVHALSRLTKLKMADIRDILDIEQPTSEITRESILNGDKSKKKYVQTKTVKRPEGMHREVFALLYNDNKELPPLLPTDTGKAYKQIKARLGMRKVRKWEWAPFTNPARKDNAAFYHWKRSSDEPKEYPFAQFNKQVQLPSYTESEYNQYLRSEDWSQAETDHLMDLCQRFDLRFIVIHDRWDKAAFRDRSIEDLKERYYNICGILSKVKTNPWSNATTIVNGEKRVYHYDAEHERKRKEQLNRLFERTQEQIDEEQMLLAELKKIEVRKKERERKTQDLQKLISRADSGLNSAPVANNVETGNTNTTSSVPRRHDRKLHKKKLSSHQRPVRAVENVTVEWSGIRFPEARGAGVWLRSQRMKLPPGVGQRKTKAIEQELRQMNIDVAPTPTEAICRHFNELRSDLALALDLKNALSSCEFELQALRHQYEALNPGKTLTIPASICSAPTEAENKPSGGEIIDVVGSPSTHQE